jgi:hypothetical protein
VGRYEVEGLDVGKLNDSKSFSVNNWSSVGSPTANVTNPRAEKKRVEQVCM